MRSSCRDERAGGIFIHAGVSVCASVFVCLHVQVRPCTSIKVTVVNNIRSVEEGLALFHNLRVDMHLLKTCSTVRSVQCR